MEITPWINPYLPDDSWMSEAACIGMPLDTFFPHDSRSAANSAKAICADCSVAPACLHYAIEGRIEEGVWGGTSRSERRRLAWAWRRDWLEFTIEPELEGV